MTAQLAFAFLAGSVATANPCGFALLPAYLARQLGADAPAERSPAAVGRAFLVGALTTAGFLLVFGGVGAAVSLGARSVIRVVPWAALAIGAVLVLAGIAVLAGKRVAIALPSLRRGSANGYGSVLLFGIGYGIASLSCTLPIFLAVVGTAIAGSPLGAPLAFAAYATGMGTVLTALAVAAALSRVGLARSIRRLLPYVTRLGGALMVAAGAYILYYWAFALLPRTESGSAAYRPIATGNRLSAAAQQWLSSGAGQTALALVAGAVGLALISLFARRSFRASREPTRGRQPERRPARAQAED